MQSENSVAFKVFVSEDGDKPEVRRFFIDRGVVTNFEYLKAKLQSVFPSIKDSLFTVSWKDDEQDEIVISSDEELILALSSIQDDLKKLYVKKTESVTCDAPAMEIPFAFAAPEQRTFDPQRQHPDVVCDSCEGPVTGYRYKCVTCDDYDLCMRCEGNNAHSEHFMIRIPVPVGPLGGKFTKVVGHHLFKSLRRVRAFDVENGDGDCIFAPKRHRKEKASGDEATPEGRHGRHQRGHHEGRGHHFGRHEGHPGRHEGHPGRHEGRPGRHCGRGASWLDTVSAYINEFANLAGDLNSGAQNGVAPAAAASANPSTSQTASQAASAPPNVTNINGGNAPNGNTPANGHIPANNNTPINGNTPKGGDVPVNDFDLGDLRVQYLQNVGRTIARILDPLGIDVDIDVRPRSNGNENKETQSNASATTSSNVSQDEHNIPAKESVEKDVPIVDLDDSSSSDESLASLSGDTRRSEGWTMLNTDEPVKETSRNAPANPINIGFDLDRMTQEFNKHLELQSRSFASNEASAQAGIYPVIPQVIPSAPKETPPAPMEVVVEQPKQPTPPIVPAVQTPPVPTRMTYRLSSPRIAEAFERMLAMGFKDDNGRLARLLEAKDGNISAVLDILSQNIP